MVRFAKILVRFLGTIAGLYGVLILSGLPTVVRAGAEVAPAAIYAIVVVQVAFVLYLLWVAYLAWFQFSPQAVRQCCGLLGFIVLIVVTTLLVGPASRNWSPLVALLAIPAEFVAVLWGYRSFARYLNRLLFPPDVELG